ncbi:LOW QUALITY PROTEIN: alpha-1-acid glycoprotein 1-like [Numida meleagris]|uniref:LOW QUALITY PROTEIN: alpha-1-acid glycoprotein 1-like n=1 Tax=Numida meleagris TaxID=8996 RepID=UPI000B3DCBD8|nr:LOW QUALITY PROTEIN: alpha-1-acid glycoprotein 1-like [Numida meleagris]
MGLPFGFRSDTKENLQGEALVQLTAPATESTGLGGQLAPTKAISPKSAIASTAPLCAAACSGSAKTNSRGSSVHLSTHTAASLAPLPPAAMAPAGVSTILILTSLLPAAAAPHEPTPAPSLANTTAPWPLGMWWYVAGAAQLPQHLLELLLIDHGHLRVEPGVGQELLITQHVAVGDQCLSNNSTSILLAANGTALLKHAKTQLSLGTVTNLGSEDTLLIQHQVQRDRTYSALYLYARNRTVSSTQREELGRHAESLGLSRGDVVYAPWRKELCQPGETERREEEEDGGAPGTAPPSTAAGGHAGSLQQ